MKIHMRLQATGFEKKLNKILVGVSWTHGPLFINTPSAKGGSVPSSASPF